jgi:hypothetical protein
MASVEEPGGDGLQCEDMAPRVDGVDDEHYGDMLEDPLDNQISINRGDHTEDDNDTI